MYYDKKSGEIKMKERVESVKRKHIKNVNDLERERKALFAEVGLNEEGEGKGDENSEKLAEKIRIAKEKMINEFDIDPTNFYVMSRDFMRVDIGLLIQRPPIFMLMRDRDVEYLKFKNDLMNEYKLDQRKYIEDFEEASKLNEDVLGDNPYSSKMNIDNFPTHRYKDPETGEEREYCAASKNFANVDPTIEDRKSLHYAGEDRTYLILKNKYTKEWEFPTGKIFFGESFIRGKQNLFNTLSNGWKVKYFN